MINPVNNNTTFDASVYTAPASAKAAKATTTQTAADDKEAAVYEKSETAATSDATTISRMQAELAQKKAQFQQLVERMLLKQGKTYNQSIDVYALLRSKDLSADPETIALAKKDVAEDGYWGVEQTSNRLVEFAKALSGGDASKADLLIDAMKKGFEEATGEWGDDLPELCQKTLDTALEKMEAWKNGTEA